MINIIKPYKRKLFDNADGVSAHVVNKLATSRDIEYLKLRRLLSDLENIVNKKKC